MKYARPGVSRFYRYDWQYAIDISKLPFLRPASIVIWLMPLLLEATADVFPIVQVKLPQRLWVLWFASVAFVFSWATLHFACPKFVREYRDFGEFLKRHHSHRWIVWEFYHNVKSFSIWKSIVEETVEKGISIDTTATLDLSVFRVCPLFPSPGAADDVRIFKPVNLHRDIYLPIHCFGRRIILLLQEDDPQLEKKEKELFWILYSQAAKRTTAGAVCLLGTYLYIWSTCCMERGAEHPSSDPVHKRDVKTYKHFVTISSQLYFCSSPIRLDSYNRCQFGCVYCFSRNRAAENSATGIKEANTRAFAQRLERVADNRIQCALDEFLHARVPLQLGGMQDPFSPFELTRRTTFDLLSILREHDYPTLISTKGSIFTLDAYRRILERMNVYVRLSAAGVGEDYRRTVDVGCGTFGETIQKIKLLVGLGLPASLRIQPVIPGFEERALEMTEEAARAGISHVSFEYLKLGSEALAHQLKRLSDAVKFDIWKLMHDLGMKRLGRDYTLTAKAKYPFLCRARTLCSSLGVHFGAADTEFIHLSDGEGCCNSSSLFLRRAKQFRANWIGVVAGRRDGELIRFADLEKEWSPRRNVHQYLTTNSRSRDRSGQYTSWMSLLAHRWNGGRGPYSPEFFHGVRWTGNFDERGFKIYQYIVLSEKDAG